MKDDDDSCLSGSSGSHNDGERSCLSGSSGSHNDGESSTSGASGLSKLSKEEQAQLADRETQLVRRSRVMFIVLLLSLTAVAVGLTYYFTKKAEQNHFEEEVRQGSSMFSSAQHLSICSFDLHVLTILDCWFRTFLRLSFFSCPP
jgi:hypothetical protein